MQIITHEIEGTQIAEIKSEQVIINNIEDGLDLVGTVYFEGFDRVIIYQKHISPEFFDLKTGMAGEILQKFTNYRVRLTIVGQFQNLQSQSLTDFVYESNQGKQVNFLSSLEEALERLSKF